MKNFTTKAASLKANVDAARAALETALKESPQAFKDAQGVLKAASKEYYAFLYEIAARLNKEWRPVQKTLGEKKIIVYDQFGGHIEIGTAPDIYVEAQCEEFTFTLTPCSLNGTLARYDTPEQVKTVIELFAAACLSGDPEFQFPSVTELK